MQSIVALIPARSGSKRVIDKNSRKLGPHPLMAYTIAVARESGRYPVMAAIPTQPNAVTDPAARTISGNNHPLRCFIPNPLQRR